MRLATYRLAAERPAGAPDDLRIGSVEGDRIRDLTGPLGVRSVRALLEAGSVGAAWRCGGRTWKMQDVALDLPVHDPRRILCVGVNYLNRNEEYGDGAPPPEYPSLFMRTPSSLVAHGVPLIIPRESPQLDYEGEIALVIGRGGRRIAEAEAMAHVAGVTLMNEGSVRDWMRHGKFNVTQGKNFDRSGAMGPWLETDPAQFDPADMRLETRVNGEVRQSDATASMAFPFPRLIAYISTFMTLHPGDVIATGTPTGAGARFDPPRWLVPGDVVEVTGAGMTLSNPVAAEGTPEAAAAAAPDPEAAD